METTPTNNELTEFSIKMLKGVEVGLGTADPLVDVSRKLEAQYPGHLVLVQAGKFLHGFDRTAYALHVLKKYRLKLGGTTAAPHIRAGFPAGIVHWMLYQHLLPIWQPRFIHDTYGNLPGRGTHAAVRRLADFCRRERCTWALQLDISKYFYAVPHEQLKTRALRYIGDEEVRRLIVSLIDSFRTGDNYDTLFDVESPYRQTPAKGMPIGNLSSQLFANIYLNDFDHWVKQTLRVRHYIRYVDDMAILSESPEQLHTIRLQIVDKLADDGLIIHPHKTRIAPVAAGVPFLGYVVWPNSISAGQRLRRRYHYRLRQHEAGQDRSEALHSYRAALAFTQSSNNMKKGR